MIESLIVVSLHSDTPLAEIRTDGTELQIVEDLSHGAITQMAQGSLQQFKDLIQRSSHFKIVETPHSHVKKLGFILASGDTVEATTDGKTATLNGRLMNEQAMNNLKEKLEAGEVEVSYRPQMEDAKPLVPEEEAPPEG